ncbi:MAG: GGGtGRT protein, partial [Thermoguttaceae bacterium]|nr:GGGtGRT protein [Thermoguttaceae bacterium]
MVTFESFERRIGQIKPVLDKYGFADLEALRDFNLSKGVDAEKIVRSIQPIAFENA